MTQPVAHLNLEDPAGGRARDECRGPGALATSRGPLPLRSLSVTARIDGVVARTEVEQVFVNNLGETLEATYIFPLPDRAAVTGFRLIAAGRTIDGILKERGEARRDYDEAIARGHRAAIAEEERPDVFTLRVGNLPANEEIRVELTLVGPLAVDVGEATYRFPLVVAPRYIPGVPLDGEPVGDGTAPDTDAVPDASRIRPPVLLPGYPHPVGLAISVELNAPAAGARDLRSSLPATTEVAANGVHRIRVVPGRRLDRDFVLRFGIGAATVTTSLVVERDADGAGEGTFLLTVIPPAGGQEVSPPRDIAFVLDRSGSMAGWKIVAARRAMASMVETLQDADRLSVLAFDTVTERPPTFERGLVPATSRNRAVAAEFLARIEARGGTEMAEPLLEAVKALAAAGAGRDRTVVLVTDGQIGNEDQILREVAKDLHDVRVFALGIDSAVNAGFLNRLTAASAGAFEPVESEARLEEVMEKVHRLLAAPVLTDLRLDPAGLEVRPDTVTPSRLPALFPAVPAMILGRWSGDAAGSLSLKARDRGGKTWAEAPVAVDGKSGALAALWARGRIRDLEDLHASSRRNQDAISKEIVATSLRFSVLSRFTAYVAVDREGVVEGGGELHRVVQPVEMPAGWTMSRLSAPSACMDFIVGSEDAPPGRAVPKLIPRHFARFSVPMDSELVRLVKKALAALSTSHRLVRTRRSVLKRIVRLLSRILAASVNVAGLPREPIERMTNLLREAEMTLEKRPVDPAETERLLDDCKAVLEDFFQNASGSVT